MVGLPQIDILAVALATLAYYLLGALWYSLLFQKAWLRAIGKDPETLKQEGMPAAAAMTGMFVVTLVTVLALAALLDWSAARGVIDALAVAAVVAVGFLLIPLAADVFFEGRSKRLFAINMGYHTTGTLLAGLVLGLFL